jgi:MFS family permease
MLGITVSLLATGLLNPLLGTAIDRYSLRILMLVGSGALAVAYVALSFVPSIWWAIAIYAAIMPVGAVLVGPVAASALLTRWFSGRRGLAMGIAAGGSTLGSLILPPSLQGLIDLFAWHMAFRIFAAIILAVTLPVILYLVINDPAERGLYPDGADHPPDAVADRSNAEFASTWTVLRDVNFWLIALIFGSVLAGSAATAVSILPIVAAKGFSADKGALLIPVLAAGAFTGKVLFAPIADRVDLRLALGLAMLCFGLGMFGFLSAHEYVPLIVAAALVGIGGGAPVPLWSLIISRAFGPANIGRVMGLMTFVITPITLITPLFFGRIFDRTGSYNPVFMIEMGVVTLGALLLLRVRTEPAARLQATPAT